MNLSRNFLAGAILALLPLTGAFACNTAAWNGTPGANAAVADDPDSNNATNGPADAGAVPRYAGHCGLKADAAGQSWVSDNSPNDEAVYRARFYVRAGQAGSKIFSATTADNGGGTEVVGITFTGTAFQFDVNGTTGATANGITSGPWYSIEISYDDNGPFSATVASGGANAPTTQTVNTAGNAGALKVGSVRIGHLNAGGAGASTFIDEFDSSRGATAIGRLCPGDANASGGRTVADAALIRNEVLTTSTQDLITGQPDSNDSGGVTAADSAIVRNLVLLGQGACPAN
jgi:hypothetical protein